MCIFYAISHCLCGFVQLVVKKMTQKYCWCARYSSLVDNRWLLSLCKVSWIQEYKCVSSKCCPTLPGQKHPQVVFVIWQQNYFFLTLVTILYRINLFLLVPSCHNIKLCIIILCYHFITLVLLLSCWLMHSSLVLTHPPWSMTDRQKWVGCWKTASHLWQVWYCAVQFSPL